MSTLQYRLHAPTVLDAVLLLLCVAEVPPTSNLHTLCMLLCDTCARVVAFCDANRLALLVEVKHIGWHREDECVARVADAALPAWKAESAPPGGTWYGERRAAAASSCGARRPARRLSASPEWRKTAQSETRVSVVRVVILDGGGGGGGGRRWWGW